MATLLDTGLLYHFLPLVTFLFIFSIVYIILENTDWLGKNKSLKFIAALSIALISLFAGGVVDLINYIVPWFVFIFIFLILLFMGLTFLGIEKNVVWNNLSIWTVMVISFLLLLIGITQVYSSIFTPYADTNVTKTIGSETLRTVFHPRVLGAIFILIISSLTIRFVAQKVESK
ncbi:MAG: hypothetical protein KJ623_00315 [Nanoarchaeota archaeon]|nr:hypothetical protein [Nanoarchaeota archaeon]MBU0963229.1 hypothetical protein [Nanoarchaeota archaeon]